MIDPYQSYTPVFVFDLDGTLACGKHRRHLLPTPDTANRNEAWDCFNLACHGDHPIQDNIDLLNLLAEHACIVILTGRSAIAAQPTYDWLAKHHVRYDAIYMRDTQDHRPSHVYKKDMLEQIEQSFGRIVACFDDLTHVVHHIRQLGYTCHQVTDYDTPTLDTQPEQSCSPV